MYIMPTGMFLSAAFLSLWRIVPPWLPAGWSLGRRLVAMVTISLLAWVVAAAGLVFATQGLAGWGVPHAALGWGATGLIALFGVIACWRNPPAPRGRRRVSVPALLARGVPPGLAIAAALLLAPVAGPLVGGIMAVFPAIFLTAMVSLWLSQGEAVQGGAVGPMMLGSTAVATYAILAALTLPSFGLVLGSAAAWLGAALFATLPAWWWLGRRSAVDGGLGELPPAAGGDPKPS